MSGFLGNGREENHPKCGLVTSKLARSTCIAMPSPALRSEAPLRGSQDLTIGGEAPFGVRGGHKLLLASEGATRKGLTRQKHTHRFPPPPKKNTHTNTCTHTHTPIQTRKLMSCEGISPQCVLQLTGAATLLFSHGQIVCV